MKSLRPIAMLATLWLSDPIFGQTKNSRPPRESPSRAVRDADPDAYVARERSSRMQFRIGLRIDATGNVQRATATVLNPMDWPEQQLTLVSEEIPFGIQVETRKPAATAQQMILRIPGMQAGSSAVCTRTYEGTRWTQRVIPEARAKLVAVPPDRARPLLAPSEGIESMHAEIRKFATESIGDKTEVWDRATELFRATQAKIKVA